MKKTFLALATAAVLAGCTADGSVLRIGATPVPHAELLELVSGVMAEAGFALRIVEFTDFITPNMALMAGDIDANFFQHMPFLRSNAQWYTGLTPVFAVHVEPFGLYSLRFAGIDELPHGATVAIPADPSNGGRALLLLQANGLITLREGAGLLAMPHDIIYNPRGLVFHALEAAQLPRSLEDVDAAAINGNFAMQAGLNPVRDSLIIEDADAESPFANVVVVRRGYEDDPRILALQQALLSPRVREFIETRHDGGVLPVF